MIRFLCLLFMIPLWLGAYDDVAYIRHQAADEAPDSETRKGELEAALKLYLQLETDTLSAKLSYNIANTYFELGETSHAILYYYKALKEEPQNELVQYNLNIALEKANLGKTTFPKKMTYDQKAKVEYVFLFVAFALLTWDLWIRRRAVRWLGYLTCALALALLLNLLFPEQDAVVMHSVLLREDMSSQSRTVDPRAILAGTKVEVLSGNPKSSWMKVRTPSGIEGYIPKENARII